MPEPYKLPQDAIMGPSQPPARMDNRLANLLNSLFGPTPQDIELPAEGPMDQRLVRPTVDKMLNSGAAPLAGLKSLFGR